MTTLGISSVLDKGFKQALCASNFDEFISATFCDGPVNKIRHYGLALLLGLLRYNSIKVVIKQNTVRKLIHWLD